MPATLLELCEPLFQYICRLNRMGRKGSSTDYATARADILQILDQMSSAAKKDVALGEQFRRVELGLLFFIDSMIAESSLPFAGEWNRNRLAYERNELAGDEKFFDLVDETLRDSKEGTDERLAVFYTCMGLGFTGWYAGQPEYLRKKMMEIAPRVKAYVDSDETALITPDAYQNTNTTNLPMPVGSSLVPVLIVLVGLILLVGAVNVVTFRSASNDLNDALDSIVAREATPAAETPAE